MFVDFLYGRQNTISNAHFTVREGTGVTDVFVCNNNNDSEDWFMFKLHMFSGLNDEYLHLLFCELVKEKWQFDLSEIC